MPDRSQPQTEIAFRLISSDGKTMNFETDQKGWAAIPLEFSKGGYFSMEIESDGQSYAAATIRVACGGVMPIFLTPIKQTTSEIAGPRTVSVARLKKAPGKARSARDKGLRALAAGHLQDAVVQFEKALAIEPDYPDALNDLGSVLLRMENLENAEKALTRAVDLCPEFEAAQVNLAILWTKEHRCDEAIQSLRHVFRENPSSALVLIPLADALLDQGSLEEAETFLLEALKSDHLPSALKGRLQYRYGKLLILTGRCSLALVVLEQASRMLPRDPNVHLELGTAAVRAAQFELAERELKSAYRFGGAATAVSQLLLGRIYYGRGQTAAAMIAFRRYLSDCPSATTASPPWLSSPSPSPTGATSLPPCDLFTSRDRWLPIGTSRNSIKRFVIILVALLAMRSVFAM